jgi:phosphoribosyl-ATP pyrophosphohydrolase
MTKRKLETLARQHIQSNYATWTNCAEANLKYNTLVAELTERTKRIASGDCKNRLLSKNDCKKEQEVYIPLLQAAAAPLAKARNECNKNNIIPDVSSGVEKAAQSLAAKIVEENTKIIAAAQLAEAEAEAEAGVVEEETPKVNFMLIGGIAVAAIVAVILLRRK